MGTASSKKFIKQVSGTLTEEAALTTSSGAGDADRVVALNASGILDSSIVNSTTTSAGAGSSGKLAALNASGILDDTIINATVSSSASKIVKLDATGRLDNSVMPTGIGADVAVISASENLSAGDFVNIFNSSGAKARKADATTSGKEAHGFVLSAVTTGNNATVYFEGTNTGVTGMTPGVVYLATTAGLATSTAPSGSGNVVQRVGYAVSATAINFQSLSPVVLA